MRKYAAKNQSSLNQDAFEHNELCYTVTDLNLSHNLLINIEFIRSFTILTKLDVSHNKIERAQDQNEPDLCGRHNQLESQEKTKLVELIKRIYHINI